MTDNRKTVLITGCRPGGIGNSLAREFMSNGYRVFATARSKDHLVDLAELGIEVFALDVTSPSDIQDIKADISERTGGSLGILVNNAGIAYTMPALDLDFTVVHKTFETNLFSVMRMVQAFASLLIQAKGTIVNIGSIAAILPYTFGSSYNASKAALHSYSDTLRIELSPFDVKVVVVITGGVLSRLTVNKRDLPHNSIYLPIDSDYRDRQGNSQKTGMPNDVYARKVVNELIKSRPPKWLWKGTMATRVWFLSTFFPKGIWDLLLSKRFGINNMAALWKKRDA
ncbi:NAD(P)-binding protein [Guyanagaster necrorhizus]|uniref:NAD(P)-binding protein n=1 Tax=Guyanagaster necrorhizus TaxID=856835 RepID=A0A9P7VT80_9AGAR|nr:NAD(P)-binding protein [Guyanagaster necrorhizus MCA 3950]KAG7446499.1 NAD(P)-binding protein [Guyanagaster necrorhizus MCA 3950]